MITSAKNILIPTDFSDSAKNALRHAVVIADKLHAGITLLNVIEPPFNFPTNVEGVIDFLQDNSEQHLSRMIEEVKELHPEIKVKIKTQIRIGKPVPQILESISDQEFDLVILGTSVDAPNRKILFGSVSTDIILKSPKIVMAVPEFIEAQEIDFSKLLFATNFRPADISNLKQLSAFANLFNSDIHLLHVAQTDDLETEIKYRGLKELVREMNLYDKIHFSLITHEDAFKGISEFSESNEISLIVMNRYKKSIVEVLMNKNYAKKLSMYSKVPLLVFPGD